MKLDKYNEIELRRLLSPVADTAITDTPQVSEVIDCANLVAVVFAICTGALDDGNATYVVKLEHGDTTGVEDGEVADADLLGTEALASFAFGDDNETRKIGYKGVKRYVRMTITPSGNTSTAPMAAMALCFPRVLPAS